MVAEDLFFAEKAMPWGTPLALSRAPVTEDFGGNQLLSTTEVLMLEVRGMMG